MSRATGFCLCLLVWFSSTLLGQGIQRGTPSNAALIVRLSLPNSETLANPVRVELYSMGQLVGARMANDTSSIISFAGLGGGDYELRVNGADVEPQTQRFSILGRDSMHTETIVLVRARRDWSETGAGDFLDARVPAKARHEAEAGDAAARRRKWQRARQHYAAAVAAYPAYAAGYFRLGLVYLQLGENDKADEALNKSLELNPDNPRAAIELARLKSAQRKFEAAEHLLERVVAEHTENAEALFLLANAELQTARYAEAVANARRAHGMAHRGFEAVHLVCGMALEAKGQPEQSAEEYRQFLKEAPGSPLAARAHAALAALNQGHSSGDAVAQIEPGVERMLASAESQPLLALLDVGWAPPNVDDVIPAAKNGSSCPLTDVLQRTGMRVQELVNDLQQFAAGEEVEHSELDGKEWRHVQTAKFGYVAEIRRDEPGRLAVKEYRDGLANILDGGRIKLLTTGMAAMALVFHPDYVGNFVVSCEGETTVDGEAAWQLHFAQHPQVSSDFRGYWVAGKFYPIKLKGRAWVAAASGEVLRLETDLAEPIKDILKREHMMVSYRAVEFSKRNVRLRLPETAEIYMDFRGRRYRDRHSFSDYRLFSVDTGQQSEIVPVASATEIAQHGAK